MKIIATNITNLTDARYFAARGIDYLAFKISSLEDFLKVKGIIEWVEGPEVILDIADAIPPNLQEEFISEIEPAGILYPDQSISLTPPSFSSIDIQLINQIQEGVLTNVTQALNATQISKQELESWMKESRGILYLPGSDESKVGEKDFTEIDDLLDYIDDLKDRFHSE